MGKFAFITNPWRLSDISEKLWLSKYLPGRVLEGVLTFSPPLKHSSIYDAKTGENIGCLLAIPFTGKQLKHYSSHRVIRRIIQAGKMAEKFGAGFLGIRSLPLFKNAGPVLAKNVAIPVITGNSYAVYAALQAIKKAAGITGQDLKEASAVVLGADSEAGKVCALLLAREVKKLTLSGRQMNRLKSLANKIFFDTGLPAKITYDHDRAWNLGNIIVLADQKFHFIPEDVTHGLIVCSLVKGGSCNLPPHRKDILVIEEPVIKVPVDFNFNHSYPGLPLGAVCPEMAETMLFSLEDGNLNDRPFDAARVEKIGALAQKKGFETVGFIGSNGSFRPFLKEVS